MYLPKRLFGFLLCALHGAAVELLRTYLNEQLVTDLALLVELNSIGQRDLPDRIFHLFDDLLSREYCHLVPVIAEAHDCIIHVAILVLIGGKK